MNRHRLLSQMMKQPVAPGLYTHLWRLNDASGSVAPDSAGSAPLDLSPGCVIEANGVRIGGDGDYMRTAIASLAFDPKALDAGITYVVEAEVDSFGGGAYGDNARLLTLMSPDGSAIAQWFDTTNLRLYYRTSPSSGDFTFGSTGIRVGDVLTMCLVRNVSAGDIYYLYKNGVFSESHSATSLAVAGNTAVNLVLGNFDLGSIPYERPWDGLIRWAGIIEASLDRSTLDQLVADGRP